MDFFLPRALHAAAQAPQQGSVGKAVLEKRFDDYAAGSWAGNSWQMLEQASLRTSHAQATQQARLRLRGSQGSYLALAGEAKQRRTACNLARSREARSVSLVRHWPLARQTH